LRTLILTAVVLAGAALLGPSCEHKLGEGAIRCTVIDADTRVPVDSARVYVTYVDYFGVARDRHLAGLTDDNGEFTVWTSGHTLHIIDVEKEGYLSSRQWAHGAVVDLLFALTNASP